MPAPAPTATTARTCRRALRRYLPADEPIASLTVTPWKPRGGSLGEMHLVRVGTLRAGRPHRSLSLVWKRTTAREAAATAAVHARLPDLLPPLLSSSVRSRQGDPHALRSWVLTEFCPGSSGREALTSAGRDLQAVTRLARALARLHQLAPPSLGPRAPLLPRHDFPAFIDAIQVFLRDLTATRAVRTLVQAHCPLLLSGAWVAEIEALVPRPHVFTHSDLSWGNLLATARGLLVVDWGLARWFPAAIDLALWLDPLTPDLAAAVLQAYLHARGPTTDAPALSLELARCRLYHSLTRLEGLANPSDPASLTRLLTAIAFAYHLGQWPANRTSAARPPARRRFSQG